MFFCCFLFFLFLGQTFSFGCLDWAHKRRFKERGEGERKKKTRRGEGRRERKKTNKKRKGKKT